MQITIILQLEMLKAANVQNGHRYFS